MDPCDYRGIWTAAYPVVQEASQTRSLSGFTTEVDSLTVKQATRTRNGSFRMPEVDEIGLVEPPSAHKPRVRPVTCATIVGDGDSAETPWDSTVGIPMVGQDRGSCALLTLSCAEAEP